METPGVSDDLLAARLRDDFEIVPARIVPLALGADSDARVYRVESTDGEAYFLKIKLGRGGDDDLGAAVARALLVGGIESVVAPVPTKDGALQLTVDGFALILYPFVEGRAGWDDGLSVRQWTELGSILRRLHGSQLPAELARRLPRETFVPVARWSRVVEGLLANAYRATDGDPARELLALVAARRDEIRGLLGRARELGRRLEDERRPCVLCHGDVHTANVLVERGGGLRVVDWDQPILAPRERDLMFVMGTALHGFRPGSPEEAAFFAGYGAVAADPLALAYYRCEWAVQDLGAFAEVVVARSDHGEGAKLAALGGVESVFAPGGIAEAAHGSEEWLPPSQ